MAIIYLDVQPTLLYSIGIERFLWSNSRVPQYSLFLLKEVDSQSYLSHVCLNKPQGVASFFASLICAASAKQTCHTNLSNNLGAQRK